MESKEFLVETHAHTSELSPCGRLQAKELVHLYKEAGYDALIITDHYREDVLANLGGNTDAFWTGCRLASEAGAACGLKVFWAMELGFSGLWSDHLLYGIDPAFLRKYPRIFELSIQELFELSRDWGIFIVQAHPFRQGNTRSDPRYLDGLETWNANMEPEVNALALDCARQHNLCMTSGSDCHSWFHVARSGMRFGTELERLEDFTKALENNEDFHIK